MTESTTAVKTNVVQLHGRLRACSKCGHIEATASKIEVPIFRDVPWLAEVMNVKPKRIHDLILANLVPGVVRLGRTVRLQEDVVLAWVRAGGTDSSKKEASGQ